MQRFDEKRDIIVADMKETALEISANHWLDCAANAIRERGAFYVALSGGTTPNVIFGLLTKINSRRVDWKKVHVFWSDERSVPKDHSESNYNMAMSSGFCMLPIPSNNVYRMEAETGEGSAERYEKLISEIVPDGIFDLIMLGMGEDGHTASLFPRSEALKETERLVVRNFVPSKGTWRMTFTYPLINKARSIVVYVIGKDKAEMVNKVLNETDQEKYPIQKIGTETNRVLWILDKQAASKLRL